MIDGLDPGIADRVALLRSWGFETTPGRAGVAGGVERRGGTAMVDPHKVVMALGRRGTVLAVVGFLVVAGVVVGGVVAVALSF